MKKYLALIVGLGLLSFAGVASANPSQFKTQPLSTTSGDLATTTPTFIAIGQSTTTIYADSYYTGLTSANEIQTLLVQFTGSSTSALLTMNVEYSQGNSSGTDCTVFPDLCDWYGNNLVSTSTVGTQVIGNVNNFVWLAASTVRTNKAISLPAPTRFTRVIFSMSGANGTIWARLLPKQEKN